MYYITNQTNQVIAADTDLLELMQIETIEALSKEIFLGNIHFNRLSDEHIEITTPDTTFSFQTHTATLTSLLGDMQLVSLKADVSKESTEDEEEILSLVTEEADTPVAVSEPEPESLSALEDDLLFIKEPEESAPELITPKEPKTTQESPINLLEDTALSIDDELVKEQTKEEISEDELFELTIPQSPEEMIEEITPDIPEEVTPKVEETVLPQEDTSPITIDIATISQNIGISKDDYKNFLNEYIDTAITLEDDLKSEDAQKRSSAVNSLTQLSEVLQLPQVNDVMSHETLENASSKEEVIHSFYNILSRLVTTEAPEVEESENLKIDLIDTTPEPEISTPEIKEEPQVETVQTHVPKPEAEDSTGFGTIDLSDVRPIHFDFQIEAAANDLSLPVELIEEFVHDFIEQAHTETQKMLVAHEQGDLKTIQEIGHMLKGASSNLRIGALSDTLYEIQFCEDSSMLEKLIRNYWGHFLSFEQQINILSK